MQNRFMILLPLILGTFMAGIDSSIVNVSLPVMSRQFGVGLDSIEWVVTAYMLGFCIFMPLTTWLKERFGFYTLYLLSLLIFTAGSWFCAISSDLGALIVSRAVQSFGGGAITPTAIAIITAVFPKEERGKAMGWWSLGSIAGPAIGPSIGGLLTEYFGWPSIFYINLPIGVITIAIAWRSLRFLQTYPRISTSFDARGFLLFTLFIVFFQYAIALISRHGIGSPAVFIPLAGSIAGLWYFIRVSRGRKGALFNLQIFSYKTYTYCVLITIVRSIAMFGGMFLIPFLLQGQLGYSEVKSGLLLLPNSVMMALVTPLAGTLSDKIGSRKLVVPGLLFVAIAMFQFSQINSPKEIFVILAMAAMGIGLGLMVSPLTATAMSAVPREEATDASSVYTLVLQLSGTIGIAFSGLFQQSFMEYYSRAKGYSQTLATHYSIQDVFIISGIMVLFTIFVAVRLPNKIAPKKDTSVAPAA